MNASRFVASCIACFALALVVSCAPGQPQVGSQTNWLRSCESSADCGELECLCGICTATCSEDVDCSDVGYGSCVAKAENGAIAACDGSMPSADLCLPRCIDTACPSGSKCVAEVCVPTVRPSAQVAVEPALRYQTLIGFGASLAYDENLIVGHPNKSALFDTMFAESGFDVVRLGNRFEGDNQADVAVQGEIITEAASRMGRTPTLFMTAGSPPAALKANGDRYCTDANPDCTLIRTADGTFDYAGFAEHWRSSLAAYDAVGIRPDYVSLQNNADWIPPEEAGAEACRFLPTEGTTDVTLPDGQSVVAEFPGYAETLAAVKSALGDLASAYAFAGPEVGSSGSLSSYADALGATSFDGLAFNLYGIGASPIDTAALEDLRNFAEEAGKPLIQSEMYAGGLDTAILAQSVLTVAGASAYLHQGFVTADFDPTSGALIGVDGELIETLPAYHALAHFARSTDPGWLRVDAASDGSELLTSAWLSPSESSLTVVLVNPGDSPLDAAVSVPDAFASLLDGAEVTRTTFDGVERSAALGVLSADHVVRLPAHAIVTVALQDE